MKLATWLSTANIFPKTTSTVDMLFTETFSKKKKEIFQEHNPSEVFQMLKTSGVDGMELVVVRSTTDKEIAAIKQLSNKNDFPIFSIHQPLTNFFSISFQEISRLFEIARNVSARVLVLHMNVMYKSMFNQELIEEVKKLEKRYSIIVGIENMPKSLLFRKKKAIWEPEKFAALVVQKRFKITMDTTHLGEVNGDILDFYQKNKQFIVNIHMSDYKNNRIQNKLSLIAGRHLALGEGELPMREFLFHLKKDKYNGLITMEINSPLEKLLESARFIGSVIR